MSFLFASDVFVLCKSRRYQVGLSISDIYANITQRENIAKAGNAE